MLYDSDSSVQEDEEEDEYPSTSQHDNRPRSQEIFTIQMSDGEADSSSDAMTHDVMPKVHRYSLLGTSDEGRQGEGQPSFMTSLSLGNLHKARTFLNRQCKLSKSDNQCHYIKKTVIRAQPKIKRTAANCDSNDGLDSDDDVTLTTRGQGHSGRNAKRWSYEPGRSSIFSAWSTYSGFLFEHNGLSLDCCVAFIVQTCMSEQCHAYTKFLKMVAWFTILILVLMCFRPLFYHTTFQQSRQRADLDQIARVQHFDTPSLMDVIHPRSVGDLYGRN